MANIYKSKYTGAQVDDAIEKVLKAAPESGNELQKKLKEGTNITIATDGTISATNPTPSVTIDANATDDDVVILTGSGGVNSVSYDAKHAKKGPASGYTSENTTTSISGSGASGTIKIPQITVDSYGHVTKAEDESITVTMPTISDTSYSVVEIASSQTTLTAEQYTTLITSPFNKIKYRNQIYILHTETDSTLIYTSNYLNKGDQITITKSTYAISTGSLNAITSHYAAYNYIGVKDTKTNGPTENGDTYLKLYESGMKRSQFNIKGAGATTVTSDSNGNVTITSTDTNTKVTSVDNHYTPTANSTSEISKDALSTTEATWGTTSLVTGVNIQRDEKGHVTGMTLDSIKMPAKPETSSSGVTSLGGKTGAITLGSGLSISSDNVLSSTGGGSGSSIEIIDLGDINSFPANGSLTIEQLNKFISWGNNGVNAIKIYDLTEPGGTFLIAILNGNYQNRTFYYNSIWGTNKYSIQIDIDLQQPDNPPTYGNYYITKSPLSSGSSEDNEQKAYLGASFQFSQMIGQTSHVSTNVDSSVAGLTDAEIIGLIFDCSYSEYNSTSSTSYSYQIRLDDLYRMFTADSMGIKSASLTLFNQKFSLVFSDISTNYSQGTVNYNIPLTITPSLINSTDVLTINIGFTYKGFKFANGGTY